MTTGEMDWNKVWLRGGWGSLRGGNGVPKRMPRRLGHWELERDDYPKYFAYSLFMRPRSMEVMKGQVSNT